MDNEQEWRVLILSEMREIKQDVKEVRQEMSTLKLKVAGFASLVGAFISGFINKLF